MQNDSNINPKIFSTLGEFNYCTYFAKNNQTVTKIWKSGSILQVKLYGPIFSERSKDDLQEYHLNLLRSNKT